MAIWNINRVPKKMTIWRNQTQILVGGLEHEWIMFPYIGNVIISTDEIIFFRGVGIPPTRYKPTNIIKPVDRIKPPGTWVERFPGRTVWMVQIQSERVRTVGPRQPDSCREAVEYPKYSEMFPKTIEKLYFPLARLQARCAPQVRQLQVKCSGRPLDGRI